MNNFYRKTKAGNTNSLNQFKSCKTRSKWQTGILKKRRKEKPRRSPK